MGRTISQRELRNDNARIMADVAAGETFLITRNGTPIAELRPLTIPRRTFVPRIELAALGSQGPHIDAARFRRDMQREVDEGLVNERRTG